MRVLILTQHFAPEITAARVRMEAFATGLVGMGHEVEVICAAPNHPQGAIQPGYRGLVTRRKVDEVEVRYVWVRARPSKSATSRIALYGSYAAMATAVGSAARRPDIVLATSPPLPVGAAAALVAARHRVPWVLDVRDLWPDVAVALGELPEGRLVSAARRLERRLYRSAAAIVTVTDAFRDDIAARIERPEKVSVIPNGTTREWLDAAALDVDRAGLGLPAGAFLWTYAGNVGIAQGLEAAIDAAAELGEGFTLLILGEGPRLDALRERAAALPPGRVLFHDAVQPAQARRFVRASDALLVPLDARPGLAAFVPSKLFDCCAVGRPVILAAAGEARRIAEVAGAALAIAPGDASELTAAVRSLRDDSALRDRLAERGHAFAAEHLRERQTERLAELLGSLVH